MARILAVANQKGGVGKTTVSVNLAAAFAIQGHRVLLVDTDAQANASAAFGLEADPDTTLGELLEADGDLNSLVKAPDGEAPTLRVLPSFPSLAGDEIHAVREDINPKVVADRLRNGATAAGFEWVIIDCPPSLSFWTIVSLAASDAVLIPADPGQFAVIGLRQLMSTVESVRLRINPGLRILGVVGSRIDARTKLSREFVSIIQHHMPRQGMVFESVIPEAVALREAQIQGQSIFRYDERSTAAVALVEVALEVKRRWTTAAGAVVAQAQ